MKKWDFDFFIPTLLIILLLLFLFEVDTFYVGIVLLLAYFYAFWQGARKIKSGKGDSSVSRKSRVSRF